MLVHHYRYKREYMSKHENYNIQGYVYYTDIWYSNYCKSGVTIYVNYIRTDDILTIDHI